MSKIMQSLPIIALRGMTILPYMVIHFDVSRKKSINSVDYAIKNGQKIFLVSQIDPNVMDPKKDDIYSVGTVCEIKQVVKLPGGFVLPVALVTETYRLCETESVSREMDAEMLLSEARRFAREDMIAGTILREEVTAHGDRLLVLFECREMIGVFRPGIEIEGDTNDRENSERGAG